MQLVTVVVPAPLSEGGPPLDITLVESAVVAFELGQPVQRLREVCSLVDAAGLGSIFDETMERSASLYDALAGPHWEQAPYAVSMAYRMRYSMQFNLREAFHMLELRSSPQGHPSYRRVALEMHRLIAEQAGHRALAEAMVFMTTEAPELERLESERRAESRRDA